MIDGAPNSQATRYSVGLTILLSISMTVCLQLYSKLMMRDENPHSKQAFAGNFGLYTVLDDFYKVFIAIETAVDLKVNFR